MKSLNLLAVGLCLAASGLANGNCQTVISTVPYTITASGSYVLAGNLNYTGTTGAIITINASNVTIDFGNYYIAGPTGNPGGFVIGVYEYEQSNITLENGTIAYCAEGTNFGGNGTSTTNNVGHNIQNMRITYCSIYGLLFGANSPGSVVSNCQISQIGGNTLSVPTVGAFAEGSGITITDSAIATVNSPSGGAADDFGMYLGTGSFATRNTIANTYYGVYGGKYQNNLTSNCYSTFSGGIDAGNNN